MTISENNGLTVLHLAALNNDNVIVGKLLEETRVNVNAGDVKGFTSLHVASWKNDTGVFGQLFNHPKIKVDVGAHTGLTALHMAAWKRNDTILRKLLDHPHLMLMRSTLTVSLHSTCHKGIHSPICRQLWRNQYGNRCRRTSMNWNLTFGSLQ